MTFLSYAISSNPSLAGASTGGGGDSILFLLFVLLVIFSILAYFKSQNIEYAKMDNRLKSITDFTPTQKIRGSDGKTGIAIDEQRKKVCLITMHSKVVMHRMMSYKDMLSSELFKDGVTVTKTVRSSQIGGALIGGVLLGGVGAIIGGLSGKTQTSGKVNRIDLRLIVNNTTYPIHDINFLNMERARHWHALIEVIIRQADIEDKENAKSSTPQVQKVSVADELGKLADLRDAGILTNEEFQQQKTRLLR